MAKKHHPRHNQDLYTLKGELDKRCVRGKGNNGGGHRRQVLTFLTSCTACHEPLVVQGIPFGEETDCPKCKAVFIAQPDSLKHWNPHATVGGRDKVYDDEIAEIFAEETDRGGFTDAYKLVNELRSVSVENTTGKLQSRKITLENVERDGQF